MTDHVFPEYTQPIRKELKARVVHGDLKDRYKKQLEHNLEGDKDTVALALSTFDAYYMYSDDPSVYRGWKPIDDWITKNDRWFKGDQLAAKLHLYEIGALADNPTAMKKPSRYAKDHHLIMTAYLEGVTQIEWDQHIAQTVPAIERIESWWNDQDIPNQGTFTLPTEVFTGRRHHPVLLVPKPILRAAEVVRQGVVGGERVGIHRRIWIACGLRFEEDRSVSLDHLRIYLQQPAKSIGELLKEEMNNNKKGD